MTTEQFLVVLLTYVECSPNGTIETERLFSSARISELRSGLLREWSRARKSNNEILANSWLEIYTDLAPSPGTGNFDNYEMRIQQLQPAYLGNMNPTREIWGRAGTIMVHSEVPGEIQESIQKLASVFN